MWLFIEKLLLISYVSRYYRKKTGCILYLLFTGFGLSANVAFVPVHSPKDYVWGQERPSGLSSEFGEGNPKKSNNIVMSENV